LYSISDYLPLAWSFPPALPLHNHMGKLQVTFLTNTVPFDPRGSLR
jgi:hypothetical protein